MMVTSLLISLMCLAGALKFKVTNWNQLKKGGGGGGAEKLFLYFPTHAKIMVTNKRSTVKFRRNYIKKTVFFFISARVTVAILNF